MPMSVPLAQPGESGVPRSSPSHVPVGLARQVNREVVVLLGWGKAILLQLAHPLVAAGVGEHSDFRWGGVSYVRRTRHTVGAILALTFGSEQEILARPPLGSTRFTGVFTASYARRRATSRLARPTLLPIRRLLRWVHATLVVSQLNAYELFVGGLTTDEKDEYCAQAAGIAPLLAIPEQFLPADVEALERYLEEMFTSGVIEVTDTARTLGRALLFPTGGARTGPLLGFGRLASIGLLPPGYSGGIRLRLGRAERASAPESGWRGSSREDTAIAHCAGVAGSSACARERLQPRTSPCDALA